MNGPGYEIRIATLDDLPTLQLALACAIDWRQPQISIDPVGRIAETEHTYLLANWGRLGDEAFISEGPDGPIGAVWYRYWTEVQHSYGYVDSSIPELGIGVRPEYRGRGIGTALIAALLDRAKCQGVSSISLSVEQENPAIDLYRRYGFTMHRKVGAAWTMLWDASMPTKCSNSAMGQPHSFV